MGRFYQLLKFIIGWPFSLIALFFVAKLILQNYSSIGSKISHINWWIMTIGLVFFLGYYFLRSYIWQQLLIEKGHTVDYKKTNFYWAISELRRYIPGNIWSFFGRVTLFNKENVPKKTILSLLITEAQLIVISAIIVAIPAITAYQNLLHLPVDSNLFFKLSLIGIGALLLLFLFGSKHINNQKLSFLFPTIYADRNSFLLLLYCVAFILFGLGTYFTISSVIFLNPQNINTEIGIFSAGLVAGYVSIITPTGLGVREAVVTAGLSLFIPVPVAAFAAIFSRVLLIVSELIFIGISYGIYQVKNKTIDAAELFIGKHKEILASSLVICCFIGYFGTISILRYNNFYTGRFDLGNMDQAVWNTAHGRIFEVTDANGTDIISRLAFHADFILVLLAPLYYIWSDPRMLLVLQAIVVGIGGIFVYLLSADIIKNKKYAVLFVVWYCFYPALEYATIFDFHAITLATTFFLGAYYYLRKNNYVLFSIFLLLACLTKEEEWVIAGLFALYIIIKKKQVILGSLMAIFCFATFYFLVSYAIPHARGGEHFALTYYSDFGSTPSGIIKNVFFKPTKTIPILFGKDQLLYVYELFFPLGFLSLLFIPPLIFAAPDLIVDLLSNNINNHQIYYQYSAPITPFIFITAIYGFAYISRYLKKYSWLIAGYLSFCILYSAYNFGPLPGAKNENVDMITKPVENAAEIDRFLAQIPRKYSIAASNNVGSHLSHRQRIYTIPIGIDKADIVVFLLNDPYAQPSLDAQRKMVRNLEKDERYNEVYRKGDFVVFSLK